MYCCDVFRISLARFSVSKIQNSLNFFNVEGSSLIFNLIKSIMLMVVGCLHVYSLQFFVAWEIILKLIIVLENLGLDDSMDLSQFLLFYDPKNLRA